MKNLILLNKPFNVLSQFTDTEGRPTLSDYINDQGFYAAGRLDYDSEGLLLLTSDGQLQNQIAHPKHKMSKTYWVQVEGEITPEAINQLIRGVELKDGLTKPAKARIMEQPSMLWPRTPPIRERANKPTSWLELSITEGKNRQVRRMTAAVGFPTLRLIRYSIGPWSIENIANGESTSLEVNVPNKPKSQKPKTPNPRYSQSKTKNYSKPHKNSRQKAKKS